MQDAALRSVVPRRRSGRGRFFTALNATKNILVLSEVEGPTLFLQRTLLRERVRPHLEVEHQRRRALAAFVQPRRAVAARGPNAAAFPAGIGIVDAAVEPLGIKA